MLWIVRIFRIVFSKINVFVFSSEFFFNVKKFINIIFLHLYNKKTKNQRIFVCNEGMIMIRSIAEIFFFLNDYK